MLAKTVGAAILARVMVGVECAVDMAVNMEEAGHTEVWGAAQAEASLAKEGGVERAQVVVVTVAVALQAVTAGKVALV